MLEAMLEKVPENCEVEVLESDVVGYRLETLSEKMLENNELDKDILVLEGVGFVEILELVPNLDRAFVGEL